MRRMTRETSTSRHVRQLRQTVLRRCPSQCVRSETDKSKTSSPRKRNHRQAMTSEETQDARWRRSVSERVMSVPAMVCMTASGDSFLVPVEWGSSRRRGSAGSRCRHVQAVAYASRLGKRNARKAAQLRRALEVRSVAWLRRERCSVEMRRGSLGGCRPWAGQCFSFESRHVEHCCPVGIARGKEMDDQRGRGDPARFGGAGATRGDHKCRRSTQTALETGIEDLAVYE